MEKSGIVFGGFRNRFAPLLRTDPMTIKDIARLSGCGVATVSRVINNYPDVSPETRKRVMEVLEKYHFEPNSNARHLKQQNGRRVAVVVKGIQNMLFAGMVEQIQQRLQENGIDAAVYYLDEEANELKFAHQVCREFKPPAILFLGGDPKTFKKEFDSISVPCVMLTSSGAELGYENLSSITTDDCAAGEQAVDHLVAKGHRKIGILGGNFASDEQINNRRVEGCRRSFEKHGIEFNIARVGEPCRFSMNDAYTATGRLMDRCPELTAIFALSDVMAIGVIRALRDRGLKVPEDISVMGYDGVPMGKFTLPRLTTIQQDTRRMAERGADILIAQLNEPQPAVHEFVPFILVEGESVGPCKA